MLDGWADDTGWWADAYDDPPHEEMQTCEANPRAALGLCAEQDAQRLSHMKQAAPAG
jgi:hypothetical protein